GDEVRQRVQPRLDLAPIMRRPMLDEMLHGRELHALRGVGDLLLVGPPHGRDAPAQIREVGVWEVDAEGAEVVAHGRLLSSRDCGRGEAGHQARSPEREAVAAGQSRRGFLIGHAPNMSPQRAEGHCTKVWAILWYRAYCALAGIENAKVAPGPSLACAHNR